MDFPYGEIVSTLPDGYTHREQWPEYPLTAEVPAFTHPQKIGTDPVGKRWGIWPFMFERYVSDIEPDIRPSTTANRMLSIVIWRRLTREDIPPGWYRFSKKPAHMDGFAQFGNVPYYEVWDASARRYRNKWMRELLGKEYTIEQIGYEEFALAYKQSSVAVKAGTMQLDILKAILASNSKHTSMWGARHIATNEIRAGLAVVDSPTYASSYYQTGFICPAAGHDPIMIGLMDHWYQHAKSKQFKFLNFGGFWHPGKDTKVWKGYSAFKAKFGLKYVLYQPELVRFRFK